MVQNQINQPGIGNQHIPKIPTKPRVRLGSQPIKPLKLPALTKLAPTSQSNQADPTTQANASTSQSVAPPLTESLMQNAEGTDAKSIAPASQSPKRKSAQRKPRRSTAQKTAKPSLRSRLLPLLNWGRSLPWSKQSFPQLKKETWQWLILWGVMIGSFGGTTVLAMLWLTNPPPSIDCQKVTLSSLSAQRLYCAQELARSGELTDLVAGMALLENWSADQPLYDEAQTAVTDWSKVILVIAHSKIAQNDMQAAIAAAEQIPPSSSVYLEAQEEIKAWRQEWQTGEGFMAKAQAAIKAQDWKLASEQVVELGYLDHEYWRIDQADVLFKQIVREKQARQNLTQAQKLAKHKTPDKLSEAITLLAKIPANTHTSPEAQTALQQWSQELIQVALQQWWNGDRGAAFATALKIPLNPSLPAEGLDLIRLSQANQLIAADLDISLGGAGSDANQAATPIRVRPVELWHLAEALVAVKQISPNSPFYEEAQAAQQTWQTHMHDLTQLGFANFIANSGDRASLNFAVAQANQIALDSPRRAQSESLIASWQQEIQALEDRPYLARAQRWASSNKIPDLRIAIAQVQQIPDDRAAWHKAQEFIAQWTAQIQTIEDQPIWDQAQKLAKQGKLEQAIDTVAQIAPDRALHSKAQTAIGDWKAKIQAAEIAEDQPILDRAYGLASIQRLTMAIDAASQIAPGRALYHEAQSAIKAWDKQRQEIWRSGGPATSTDADTDMAPEASTEPDNATDADIAETDAGEPIADDPASGNAARSGSSFEGYYDEGYQQ